MHLAENEAASRRRAADAPSADFVRAVSDFLDTDPADLLTEMGYPERPERRPAPRPVPDKGMNAVGARLPPR
jgi:hypothetical protein